MATQAKKPNNRIKKYFSVPIWIYVAVFITCVFMVLPKAFSLNNPVSDPLANIGYSLFASNVAGVLFDLGNNLTSRKKAKKQFDSVTYSHSNLLNDIILIADYTCERLNIEDYSELSLEYQLKAILLNQDEENVKTEAYIDATEDIGVWLSAVKNESDKLLNISYIMYDNSNFSEKKRTLIKFISGVANMAIQQINAHTLSGNQQAFVLINDRILRMYLKLYPEQASLFE